MNTPRYTFDPAKAAANLAAHKVAMEDAAEFDWATAKVIEDDRFDYPERRHIAFGMIGERLHVMVLTYRAGYIRIISLRKANDREVKFYEAD